jgi:hypothetical protein
MSKENQRREIQKSLVLEKEVISELSSMSSLLPSAGLKAEADFQILHSKINIKFLL